MCSAVNSSYGCCPQSALRASRRKNGRTFRSYAEPFERPFPVLAAVLDCHCPLVRLLHVFSVVLPFLCHLNLGQLPRFGVGNSPCNLLGAYMQQDTYYKKPSKRTAPQTPKPCRPLHRPTSEIPHWSPKRSSSFRRLSVAGRSASTVSKASRLLQGFFGIT